ncbi:MAG TPA: peptidylprolyl isomerase [Actinomycetes bacterium]|nr:peptidylprolyl isomerase [Actinomycetes bacterium]
MSGNKRQRELARQKYERQQARRAKQHHRTQTRTRVALVMLGVFGAIGLAIFLGSLFGGDSNDAAANQDVSQPPRQCDYRSAEGNGQDVKPVGTPPPVAPEFPTVQAIVHTNKGDITMKLDEKKAPCTVNSFVFLAKNDYFDNTKCHRLLTGAAGGVLQCGDPSATGSGGPGYQFNDENLGGAVYTKGVVAMANSGPNTNGSQFFMVYSDSGFPPSYTPFGQITKGLDILSQVAKGGVTGPNHDQPKTKVVIKDVEIVPA